MKITTINLHCPGTVTKPDGSKVKCPSGLLHAEYDGRTVLTCETEGCDCRGKLFEYPTVALVEVGEAKLGNAFATSRLLP